MILKVPFFPGKKYYCAQDCALMILKYFFPEREFDIEDIAKKSIKHEQYGTFTIGLAKALSEYDLKVDFYCRSLDGEELSESERKSFLDKYGKFLEKEGEVRSEAERAGVKIVERDLSLEEITNILEQGKPLIVLINWNILSKKEGYQGHFVVLTGFDDNFIYAHNPGPNYPEENMKIKKETILQAINYKGTNKEMVVAYL